jgi:hypothetical protein
MTKSLEYEIIQEKNQIMIKAGIIERILTVQKSNISISQLRINSAILLDTPTKDCSMSFYLANPNERPKGILADQAKIIKQKNSEISGTDALDIEDDSKGTYQKVLWSKIANVNADSWHTIFDQLDINISSSTTSQSNECSQLQIKVTSTKHPVLENVSIVIYYEIYEGFPVIRKWVKIINNGKNWIKIDKFSIDNMDLQKKFSKYTNLTPSERGACASVLGIHEKNMATGFILGCEIPSALRDINTKTKLGSVGYTEENFEWVIGPNEYFVSEACFHYAFDGKVHKTISKPSTPLDRAVERPFKHFLEQIIGIKANPSKVPVPLWCTWSNFVANIDDSIIREQAEIAARCGFKCFQIDAGWSDSNDPSDWTCGSRIPHKTKFPDFKSTCDYIKSQGLQLGLWLSCYRNKQSPDIQDIPDGFSIPIVTRGEGLGMSFASKWREYYAKDVVYLAKEYNAVYFKQDLTNMKFGDIAEGHESRTKKESLLRSIRGFLKSQDLINEQMPDVCTQLSHEIYWGTPGVPCDIEALKHCWSFHIPPNDYSGVGNRRKRVPKVEKKPFSIYYRGYLFGCFHARRRYYAHRGLPLYGTEYYGAATINADGSLSSQIQDRQICSWLMGTPTVYAGDLSSLTEDNITHYRKRFEMIEQFQKNYGIYQYFQYSGVPKPTEWGWHWWGKINDDGYGIVVVIRGFGGSKSRKINIPWVDASKQYLVKTHLKKENRGKFSGEQLQQGKIKLNLSRFGQEIIEIAPID